MAHSTNTLVLSAALAAAAGFALGRFTGPSEPTVTTASPLPDPPRMAPANTQVHLLHGEQDPVIDARYSLMAAETMQALGAAVSVEFFPDLGHGVDARVAGRVKALAA